MTRKYKGKEPSKKLKNQCGKNKKRITTNNGRYRKISALKKDCRDKRKYCKITSERNELNALIDTLRNRITQATADNQRCQREKTQLETRRVQLIEENRTRLQELERQNAQDIQRLHLEYSQTNTESERRYGEKVTELQNLEREYQENTDELERRYREKVLELQNLEREYEENTDELERRYREKVTEIERLEREHREKVREIVSKYEDTASQWENRYDEKVKETQSEYDEKVTEIEREYDEKVTEIQNLEREYEENTTLLENRYREKVTEIQNLEREYEDTASQWENRYKEKALEVKRLENDVSVKMTEVESKLEEISRLEQLVSEFRKESEIIDRIQEKTRENAIKTKNVVSQLQLEKRARKMENTKSKGLREKDLARISELNVEIRRLNERLLELEQEMEQQQDTEELQKALDECLRRKNELDVENDQLKRRIASLEVARRNANKQIDEATAKAESMADVFEKLELQAGQSEKWRKMAIDQRELCEERLKEVEEKYSGTWDAWVRDKLSGGDDYSADDDDSPV